MQKTFEVAKGLKVPVSFTIEALEDFCEETDTGLPSIYFSLIRGKGQLQRVSTLLYYVVKAGFEDLGEPMPYTKEQAYEWLKGTTGPFNYVLVTAFVTIASQILLFSNDEEAVEEQGETEKN